MQPFDFFLVLFIVAYELIFGRGSWTHTPHHRFNLDEFNDDYFRQQFRIKKAHLRKLARELELPEQMHHGGLSFSREEALAIVFMRLAYPNRLSDPEWRLTFGREGSQISKIFSYTMKQILNRFTHLLYFDPVRLTKPTLRRFANKIHEKGAPLGHC